MAASDISSILVVVRNQDDGEIVLDKAHRLARSAGASLHVISVMHEDFADLSVHDEKTRTDIRTYVCQSGESLLEDLLEPLRGQGVDMESACIWHKYEWQGVLDVAADIDADLIIKGTDYPVKEFVRTPSDWNLLRHAKLPVMLVKPVSWVECPVVLAAVDATEETDADLNKRVLTRSHELATALGGEVHVVNVYPSVEHWVGPVTLVINFDAVRQQVGSDIESRIGTMLDELGLEPANVHTREGLTAEEIHRAVIETGAEILVMGTHHRTGPEGAILGNTSEKILHAVRSDIEVVR